MHFLIDLPNGAASTWLDLMEEKQSKLLIGLSDNFKVEYTTPQHNIVGISQIPKGLESMGMSTGQCRHKNDYILDAKQAVILKSSPSLVEVKRKFSDQSNQWSFCVLDESAFL